MNNRVRKGRERKNGSRRVAVLGASVLLAVGMVPGITLGSMAAIALLAHLTGRPVESGWMARTAVISGGLVGAVTAAAIALAGAAIAGKVVDSFLALLPGASSERLPQRRMAADTAADIRARSTFLAGLRSSFHSLVVVGSAAHGVLEEGSDYDVVLISKEQHVEILEDAVAGQVLAGPNPPGGRVMEYTVLRPDEARSLFLQASPFAHALRHGVVLQDDGFLADLSAGPHPALPGPRYFRRALYENILIPYYGSFRALQQNARKNSCTPECCGARTDCPGLMPAETAARVILRMLYVTLPARGCLPLTKQDVIDHTRRIYGDENAAIVERAAKLCRRATDPLRYTDLVRFKRFAGERFREILAIIGSTPGLRSLLADGASMVQGKYGQIRDRNLRHCVASSPARVEAGR